MTTKQQPKRKNPSSKRTGKSVSLSNKQGDVILVKRAFDNSDFWIKTIDFSLRKRKPLKKKDVKTNLSTGIVMPPDEKKLQARQPQLPGGRDLTFTADDGTSAHTVSDGGGPKITNVNVHLLLWGSQWLSASNNPSAGSVVNAIDSIITGPYMNALNQYGIGSGTLADAFIITSPNPPNPFSDNNVADMVWNVIDAGFFPEPDDSAGRNEFFAFIMPPGVNTNRTDGAIGLHTIANDYDFLFDFDNAWYCWVMNNGTLDSITQIFSHELVEACTDPEGSGIQVNPRSSSSWLEIGDICQNSSGRLNGVWVQSYWSQSDRVCIIPTIPTNPMPPEFRRKITVNAHFHVVDPGIFSDDVGDSTSTRAAVVDLNSQTAQIVINSLVVGGESTANLIANLTWNNDLSVNVAFTSALFDGTDVDTSTGNNFNLGRDTWQSWWVNHHSGDWIEADSCHIDFDIHNDQL
jgi:hypothetical protein